MQDFGLISVSAFGRINVSSRVFNGNACVEYRSEDEKCAYVSGAILSRSGACDKRAWSRSS